MLCQLFYVIKTQHPSWYFLPFAVSLWHKGGFHACVHHSGYSSMKIPQAEVFKQSFKKWKLVMLKNLEKDYNKPKGKKVKKCINNCILCPAIKETDKNL